MPIDPTKLPVMERVAKEWFARLTSEFGSLLEHREKFLVSAPAVMAALGAVGHPLVAIEDDAARRATARPVKQASAACRGRVAQEASGGLWRD